MFRVVDLSSELVLVGERLLGSQCWPGLKPGHNNFFISLVGIQRMLIRVPVFSSFLTNLEAWSTCPWPDRCRGFFSVSAAALLLLSRVIMYPFTPSSMFNAHAIAASSAEYAFCSALTPSVTEKAFSVSFRQRGGCFSIAPPNPTNSLRAKLLTPICMYPPASV